MYLSSRRWSPGRQNYGSLVCGDIPAGNNTQRRIGFNIPDSAGKGIADKLRYRALQVQQAGLHLYRAGVVHREINVDYARQNTFSERPHIIKDRRNSAVVHQSVIALQVNQRPG